MDQFFTKLAETLKDRQELRINIKKIDGDLVAIVVPDFKDSGKNIQMTGSPAEFDENFLTEIQKPMSVEKTFTSNADEVKKDVEEEEESEEKPEEKKDTQKPIKKVDKKKPAAKKGKKVKLEEEEEPDQTVEEVKPEVEHNEVYTPESEINPEVNNVLEEKEEVQAKEEVLEIIETKEEDVQPEQPVISEEDGPSTKEIFEALMAEGKQLFEDRKYKASEAAYQKAVDLMPDNETGKAALTKSTKWVAAMVRAGINQD